MSRVKVSLDHKGIRRLVWLVLTILVLLGYSLQSVAGGAYYSLLMQTYTTVDSPPVILEEGVAGTSTIYTNNTSAKVSVEASFYDHVDNNDPEVDSNADKGIHSDFPAQQYGPDSAYDTLEEENTEAIEDYVDQQSDIDSSSDLGSHDIFNDLKAIDSTYDNMTEVEVGGGDTWEWSETVPGGYTSTSSYTQYIFASDFTPSSSYTATRIGFYAFADPQNSPDVKLAIYNQSAGEPAQVLGETAIFQITGSGWLYVDLTSAVELSSGVTYSVAHITEDAPTTQWRYREANTPTSDYYTLTSWPDFDEGVDWLQSGSYRYGAYRVGYATGGDYQLDLEVQFTNVVDFLPTEKLYIYAGTLGDEDLRLDYWNGTGWENLATDLTAYSCNEYTVSLTSTNFTIRFKGGVESSDTTQDQWQIDASLLRGEGAGDKEDAVDNDTSDEDSSSDLGVLTDFTNMTAYDANVANLTETTGGVDGDWGDTNNPGGTSAAQSTARAMGGTSPDVDNMTLTSISVWWGGTGTGRLAVYQGGTLDNPTGATLVWDAGEVAIPETAGWVTISGGSASLAKNEVTWITWKCDDANYYYETSWDSASDFQSARGRAQLTAEGADSTDVWDATIGTYSFNSWWYDMYINYTVPTNYQLDQEVQWTDVPYLLPNENLSIYCGTIGAEDIKVDVWNGTDWETVFTDLSSGWNNASVTDWLTTSNFTIRFKGGNETGDISQDTWQIDVALIHVWHDGGESYELDLEVQWTSADYTRTNEELCIKTGTFSGSENVQVKVWNNTGSSWHWIMNLTASQWNNVSMTSYLTSSTFTVQFLGGTETGDISGDSWNIDTALLHVWTDGATYDYVLRVNNTVTDSWQIRLKKYSDSNINRLQNCTIYFHNSTDGTSSQIDIQDGLYINQTGPWYDLGDSETIYIAMTAQANSTGTSYVHVYLEILTPGTTTYAQYIIAFEIT